MRLEPVIKLGQKNNVATKNMTMTTCWKTDAMFSFFRFIANLKSFVSGFPDVWFIKLKSSIAASFCFRKTGHRTKKSLMGL